MKRTEWGVSHDYTFPVEFIPWDNRWKFGEDADRQMLVDSRLYLISEKRRTLSVDPIILYKNYVSTFCEFTNLSDNTTPVVYAKCGFLPIGVEPECLCGLITYTCIVPKLQELGLEFFEMSPSSPLKYSYKPIGEMSTNRDIWISKLEAAKIVKKPVYNITSKDVLEVIL